MSPRARRSVVAVGSLLLALLVGPRVAAAQECADDPQYCPPNPVYGVQVSPDGAVGPTHSGWGGTGSVYYTVTNTGNVTSGFSISCAGSGVVTCTGTGLSYVDLDPGLSANVYAYYQTTGLGSGGVVLTAQGSAIDEGSYTIWVDLSVPVISLAPHSSGVLPLGTDVVFSHATPAYFSLGQARALTVAYNSSTARPTPVLLVDVSNSGQPYPIGYSVEVRRAGDNSLLTLLNGSQSVYYSPATTQPRRLAAALDAQANGLVTGWHAVTVTVTSSFTGATRATTVATRLLVVDRTGSSFGKGVDVVGVQRVYLTPGSGSYSVLVTGGDGSAAFFDNIGNCQTCSTFTSPPGEQSTLSKVTDPAFGTMYRRRYPDGSIVDFTSDGRIRRSAGRFGDTTQFIWTDTLLTQIRDPVSKTLTMAYSSGKLQSVTDPAGRVTSYTIHGSGRLNRITDPDNVATNLAYDANNVLTSVTDRGGQLTSFTYDGVRRVDTTYAPAITIHTGASVRPRITVTAPERIVWQPSIAGTSAATAKAAIRADTLFAVTVGPNGAVTKTALDRFRNAAKIIGPYGETTTITRDTLGRALVTTEPNGHVTRLSYRVPLYTSESPYAISQVKDSTTGRTVSYTYPILTNLPATVSGDITRVDMVYHNGSRGPMGAVDTVYGVNRAVLISTHLPDALGRDTLVRDGSQHRTRRVYDTVWGSVREETSPRGSVTRFHYDAAGRVDSAWVPGSGLYTYQYDSLNRRTQVKAPLGFVTRFVYGPTTLDRIIDPKGQVYKFAYNALGALVARHDLGDTLKADTLKYDEAGNVRVLRTRRGDVVTMTYDLLGRLVSRSGPDFPVDSNKYDPAGRWNVAWNVNGRDSLAYDQAGRLVTTRQALPGGAYQLTYTYDIRDRLTQRTPPVGTSNVKYSYKPATGLLDTLCAVGACVAFGYGGDQFRDTMTYNPGVGGSWKRFRYYDSTHTVARDSFTVVGLDTLFGGRWNYDSLSRLVSEDRYATGFATKPRYTYDALGRLIDACDDRTVTIYDINGNPVGTSWSCINEYGGESHPLAGGSPAYAYDSAGNRIDPAANATIGPGSRTLAFRGYTLAYDPSGRLTSKTGNGIAYTYTWDALGRLKEVRNGGVLLASFAYDALGRRVNKTRGDGTTERYVYDGDQVILDLTGAHAVAAEYGHNPGTDRLFAIRNNLSPTWTGVALPDPMVGTVRGIANLSGGTLRKKYQLTAWGQVPPDTGIVTRYRMAGREYDHETKLYYVRARYYDPELGRFLSEDPAGLEGGLNQYVFAGNDPVNQRDPSGQGCEAGEEQSLQMASASGSDDDDKGNDCGTGGESGGSVFRTWADVFAWIDWAWWWMETYDVEYLSWNRGYVEGRYYVPKAGDEASFLIDSRDYVMDENDWYKQTVRFPEYHIFTSDYNTRTRFIVPWRARPWGEVRFFLSLDPEYLSARTVAFYNGLIELVDSNHRWFHATVRVYSGRWATVYVGVEATGVGPRF